MKSNIVLKILAVVFIFTVVAVIVIGNKRGQGTEFSESNLDGLTPIETGPSINDNGLGLDLMTDSEIHDQFAVDVDTPTETMETLTQETRRSNEEAEELQKAVKSQSSQVERLLQMEERVTESVANELERIKNSQEDQARREERDSTQVRNLLLELEQRFDEFTESKNNNPNQTMAQGYEINAAGIPSGLGYDTEGSMVNFDDVVWVSPVDAKVDPTSRDGSVVLPDFGAAESMLESSIDGVTTGGENQAKEKKLEPIKAYTIPANATMMGSVSMTALLGRIPIGGNVTDPYPFKLIIGEDNLSSNGINIPNVTGIKMSGIATGDWTLSCVSGQVTSMTFTFNDGRIVTYPEPGTGASSSTVLAWLSDRNGIPCITGKRITNAPQYLASRIGLTAAAAYAKANAAAQITTTRDANGTSSHVSGDPKVLAQNEALSSGIEEGADWLDQRQANSFDAIYVEPGTELAVHITEQLKIDYDPNGRKINHYAKIKKYTDYHLD